MLKVKPPQNSTFPIEVISFVKQFSDQLHEYGELVVALQEKNISAALLLDAVTKASLKKFELTGNPILSREDIKTVGWALIRNNAMTNLIEKGFLGIVGLDDEGIPVTEVTDKGRKHIKDERNRPNNE